MEIDNSNQLLLDENKDRLLLVKVPEITYKQIFSSNNDKRKSEAGILNFFETKNKYGQDVTELEFCINKEEKGQNFFSLNLNLEDKLYSILKTDKKYKMIKVDFLGKLIARDDELTDEITNQMSKQENENIHHTQVETGVGRPASNGIIPLSEKHFMYTHADKQKAILNFDRKLKNLKKTRKDKNELMNDLFELFSEKSHWTVKSLKDKLDQPELFLKEVLSEICNYCKSGPKKGNFALKDQYVGKKDNNI